MGYNIPKYSQIKRYEFFKNTPLFFEEKVFATPFDTETVDSELYSHDVIEISIVNSGSGIHRILNTDIPCSEGDLYVVNTDIPHGYFVDEPGTKLWVSRILFDVKSWFDGNIATTCSSDFCYGVFMDNPAAVCARLTTNIKEELQFYFNSISNEMSEKKDNWEDFVKSLLSLLLIKASRYINGAIKNVPLSLQKDWGIVAFAVNYVKENFTKSEITLDAVASELFIGPSKLSRIFKQITGSSFSEYLRGVRLEYACQLLTDNKLTIEEIVHLCGLKDVPCFYRAFSARFNMSPNEYRIQRKADFIQKKKGNKFMMILSEISTNLQAGKAKLVKEMVQQAIDEGISAETILKEGLVAGMSVIGEKFKNNEVFVPEVLVAARAMNQGAALLKPLLASEGVAALGKVCIGTVQGDLHDIGKNIVKMMLEGKGFEVVDLGTDVPAEAFVKTAIEQNCEIICCSALLTTTMGVMADVVKAAEAAGVKGKIKIMVGGAPVSQDFADQIGADAYSTDAASCAMKAVEIVSGK